MAYTACQLLLAAELATNLSGRIDQGVNIGIDQAVPHGQEQRRNIIDGSANRCQAIGSAEVRIRQCPVGERSVHVNARVRGWATGGKEEDHHRTIGSREATMEVGLGDTYSIQNVQCKHCLCESFVKLYGEITRCKSIHP